MRLLIDTHIFIWYISNDSKLSTAARTLIDDENNEILLSIASLWEMAIKFSLGKLCLAIPFERLIPQQLDINAISLLNIDFNHLVVVSTLPFHHKDPFDRLMIAQAIVEKLPIISADSAFDDYLIRRFW
jgi:PIN domain nuclease of toxin-antitoxin system